jgi:diadenosine tetraphosphate (Ap4A) HIT family hydrolase
VAGCVFCAVVGGAEHLSVYRDEHVVAFLDHAPVFPGHTLVVSARHYDTLEDMPESDVASLFGLARRLSIAFRTALGADGSVHRGEYAHQPERAARPRALGATAQRRRTLLTRPGHVDPAAVRGR